MPTTNALLSSPWQYQTATTGSTTTVQYLYIASGSIAPSYPPASDTATLSQERYDRFIAETEAKLRNEWQAQERARALLLSHLSPAQRQEFETHQQFRVESADGNREYVIRHGRVQNITLTSRTTGRVVLLCIHPEIECPDEDTMLCQKLMIETNEQELWRKANKRVVTHGVSTPAVNLPLAVDFV